ARTSGRSPEASPRASELSRNPDRFLTRPSYARTDVSRRAALIALVSAAFCGLALVVDAHPHSGGSGYTEIFVVKADGTGHRDLTAPSDPAQRVLRSLTPDGRALAFDQLRTEGGYGLWSIELVPVLGGVERTLISLPGASAYGPAWSRDGKLLA